VESDRKGFIRRGATPDDRTGLSVNIRRVDDRNVLLYKFSLKYLQFYNIRGFIQKFPD